jgi:hypothetical protein
VLLPVPGYPLTDFGWPVVPEGLREQLVLLDSRYPDLPPVYITENGCAYDDPVHDRRRIDWEAGDALIVENGCVHQHLNDDPEEEAIVLVAKAKPLFLFMHLIFQKVAAWPPKEAESQAQRDYLPPTDL